MRAFPLLAVLPALACSDTALRITPPDVDPADITECGFTPVEGFEAMKRYDCNPVFTTTDEEWASALQFSSFNVTEVLGHPFYQLWYFAYTGPLPQPDNPDGRYDLGYAVSDNGTDWTPHPDNPGWPERDPNAWDATGVQRPYVEWDAQNERYLMMYGGFNWNTGFFGIGLAESPDGLEWSFASANPIIDQSVSVGGVSYCWPMSFTVRDGLYDAYLTGIESFRDDCRIYRVRTSDPAVWNGSPELVIDPPLDAWDDEGGISNAIAELDGVQYMFYVGFGRWEEQITVRYTRDQFLGLAISEDDGETWQRYGEAPLPVHMTAEGSVNMVAAQTVGSRIHVWVEDQYGEDTGIGYFLFEPSELEPAEEGR